MKQREEEMLSEEEKKALRESKFAPLPSLSSSSRSQQPPRLAHPGGALTTNKAAALAKFLKRKLEEPNGLDSINPDLVELAVKNAKRTILNSGTTSSGRHIKHVDSFGDSKDFSEVGKVEAFKPENPKKTKKKKNKKKEKNIKKKVKEQACSISIAKKRPRKS